MKKLSKLMALLLSLLMILSLFAACGDDKTDDKKEEEEKETLVGEDLLIGDWTSRFEINTIEYDVLFTFESDGTFETSLTKDSYYDIIDKLVENTWNDLSEEELAEEGIESKEDLRDYYINDTPYEEAKLEFEMSGTWELDGDTLTLENENGGEITAETNLSKGKTSFTATNSDGEEQEFKKVK